MVEIDDIRDRDSLKAWLDALPFGDYENRRIAVSIAHRAAMRVLPAYWVWANSEAAHSHGWSAHHILRTSLISGVAGNKPTQSIKAAADVAANASGNPVDHVEGQAAANAASFAAHAADSDSPTTATTNAVRYASNVFSAWEEIQSDCRDQSAAGVLLDTLPLWRAKKKATWRAENPLAGTWEKVCDALPKGDFWRDWYQDVLDGVKPNWDMLTEIALIEPEDWDKGADYVNALIAGIVAPYRVNEAIQNNPFAWRLDVDPSSKKLVSAPTEAPDMAGIAKAIRAGLRQFNSRCKRDTSENKYGEQVHDAFAPVVKDLRRDVGKFKNDALSLFDALADAKREMAAIGRNEGFANDGLVERLIGNLQTRGEDICTAAPAVLETEKNRLMVRLENYSSEQISMALRLGGGMMNDSQGVLRVAASVALRVINDLESTPEEKKNAWYFMKAAVPRGAKAVVEAKQSEPVGAEKKASKLDIAVSAADKANKLDKGVDAVQEAVNEATGASIGDWATEAYTQISSGNLFGGGG